MFLPQLPVDFFRLNDKAPPSGAFVFGVVARGNVRNFKDISMNYAYGMALIRINTYV